MDNESFHVFIDDRTEYQTSYNDQTNPDHYKAGKVECWDAIEAAVVNKEPFEAVLVGNILKYLWRYESKGGLTDIEKAKVYLNKLIELKQ